MVSVGLNPPLEKSSPYLVVSLGFGDILSEKHIYALDCMRKPLEIKNFPGGGPLDPFAVK